MNPISFFVKVKSKTNYFALILFLSLSVLSPSAHAYILSSIKPIAFITTAITDKVVKTKVLLPNSVSPHTYSLKPKDIEKIKRAELIIWVGKDLEIFLTDLLNGIDRYKQVILLDEYAVNKLIYRHTDKRFIHHHSIDSHIWLSSKIAKQVAVILHDKLITLYPEKKAQIDQNLTEFTNKLSNTEQIIAKKLINIQNKGYFVFHDAYGYFERQFGLKKLGYFTINPEIQPGAKTVYAIRHQLVNNRAVCVFKEPQFNPSIVNKVIEDTNVYIGTLDPLGSDVVLNKDAYFMFLINLTNQFVECLSRENR